MEFKYSTSILFSHMGYVFKILVWIIISLLVAAAVGAAIFVPLGNVIAKTTDAAMYFDAIKETFLNMVDGTYSVRGAIGNIVPQFMSMFDAIFKNVGASVGVVFGVLAVYLVYSFMMGTSYYAMTDVINNIMASNMRVNFSTSLLVNLKRCVKFSLSKLIASLPIDIIIAVVVLSLLFGCFPLIGFFILPVLVVFCIVAFSLRATFFSGWLPRMLNHPEEPIFTNLTRSFTFVKYNVKGVFKAFVIMFSIVYLLASVFAVPTGGVIFLVLPSIYYFLLRTIELVAYYKTHGYSFYTDAITVINTVEFGYRKANQNDDHVFGDDENGSFDVHEVNDGEENL